MSQQYLKLCEVLVEEHCGRLAAKVYACVSQYGGLSSTDLGRMTGIGPRRLKRILPIMLKQRVLLHRTDDMDTSFYHADSDGAYERLRAPRLIALVEDLKGGTAADLVSHIHYLGQASVGELVNSLCSDAKQQSKAERNGRPEGAGDTDDVDDSIIDAEDDPTNPRFTTTAELHTLLRSLLLDGFLTKVGKRSFTPAPDLTDELRDCILEDMPDNKVKAKKQVEYEEAVKNLKRQWLEEDEYNDLRDCQSGQHSKRLKLNGGTPRGLEHGVNETVGSGPVLSVNMVVRVSFTPCDQYLSDNYLRRLADRYLGDTTASVYDALLHVLRSKGHTRHRSNLANAAFALSPEEPPTASTFEVSQQLDPSLDLAFPIAGAPQSHRVNGDGKVIKKQKIGNGDDFTDIGIKNEHQSESEDEDQHTELSTYRERNKNLSLVEEHLRLLEEHPKAFCKRVVGGGRGDWGVDLASLGSTIEKLEVDNHILSLFGKEEVRLLRMLRDKGKLDEKQMAAFGIMRIKDVRKRMTALMYQNYVESVEVPKDNHRQAGRSIYLWGHRDEGLRDLILQHSYGSLAHTMRRLQTERHKYRAITEKAELMQDRPDALSKNDRDMIFESRQILEKLYAQVQRIDELVAIMQSRGAHHSPWR